eukprot:RCo006288
MMAVSQLLAVLALGVALVVLGCVVLLSSNPSPDDSAARLAVIPPRPHRRHPSHRPSPPVLRSPIVPMPNSEQPHEEIFSPVLVDETPTDPAEDFDEPLVSPEVPFVAEENIPAKAQSPAQRHGKGAGHGQPALQSSEDAGRAPKVEVDPSHATVRPSLPLDGKRTDHSRSSSRGPEETSLPSSQPKSKREEKRPEDRKGSAHRAQPSPVKSPPSPGHRAKVISGGKDFTGTVIVAKRRPTIHDGRCSHLVPNCRNRSKPLFEVVPTLPRLASLPFPPPPVSYDP